MSVDGFIEKLDHSMEPSSAEGVYLVNNAGILGPVGPAENAAALDSKRHARVNLLAPIRAATGFLRAVEHVSGRRVIADISSGAAQRTYEGWSLYCSSKAAIEMWTRVVGAEQRKRKHPVHLFSIARGLWTPTCRR